MSRAFASSFSDPSTSFDGRRFSVTFDEVASQVLLDQIVQCKASKLELRANRNALAAHVIDIVSQRGPNLEREDVLIEIEQANPRWVQICIGVKGESVEFITNAENEGIYMHEALEHLIDPLPNGAMVSVEPYWS